MKKLNMFISIDPYLSNLTVQHFTFQGVTPSSLQGMRRVGHIQKDALNRVCL
jgi:hypothetical protein